MRAWAERHPNLTTWVVLAVGMLVIMAWSARAVPLSAVQRGWLGVATVGLAGLCAWIISWEADETDIDEEDYEGEGGQDQDGPSDARPAQTAELQGSDPQAAEVQGVPAPDPEVPSKPERSGGDPTDA